MTIYWIRGHVSYTASVYLRLLLVSDKYILAWLCIFCETMVWCDEVRGLVSQLAVQRPHTRFAGEFSSWKEQKKVAGSVTEMVKLVLRF